MTFLETPRFPERIAYGAQSAPMFSTRIAELASGHEQANINWQQARIRFNVTKRIRTLADADTLLAFFRAVKGRGHQFRVKDWVDFSADTTAGRFNATGVGDGLPTAQMRKYYAAGALYDLRDIQKPVDPCAIYYDGSPLTSPAPSIAYATGIVTFGAFDSKSVTAVTPGATTDVTLSSALSGLAIGELLYLSGLTGTVSTALNGLAHTISNIAGAVYTLSTDTTGLAYTSGGTGAYYPQASKSLRWSGNFDVPCRFGSDALPLMREGPTFHVTGEVELVEVRV